MNLEKELLFTIEALRNLNVKSICELGAGDCRWAIRMANELGGEVDAVENFAWKNWDDPYYKNEYKNTNTVDDIKNICRDHNVNFIEQDVMDFTFNKHYDAVRIDCLDSEDQLVEIINRALYYTDVIIIDDISPVQVLARTSAMINFLHNNMLKLYLITQKVAILTKPDIEHPPFNKSITVNEKTFSPTFRQHNILKNGVVKNWEFV